MSGRKVITLGLSDWATIPIRQRRRNTSQFTRDPLLLMSHRDRRVTKLYVPTWASFLHAVNDRQIVRLCPPTGLQLSILPYDEKVVKLSLVFRESTRTSHYPTGKPLHYAFLLELQNHISATSEKTLTWVYRLEAAPASLERFQNTLTKAKRPRWC